MKRLALFAAVGIAAAAGSSVFAVSRHCITSRRPATDSIQGWERESYPIGNGWFGVNVFGGVESERLQVTENSFLTKRNLTNALDIRLRFLGGKGKAKDYVRSLELETGLSRVEYKLGSVGYVREAFASYPDRVMAVRLEATERGSLSFDLKPETPFLRPFGSGAAADVGRGGASRPAAGRSTSCSTSSTTT